jgi:hypothetical protein
MTIDEFIRLVTQEIVFLISPTASCWNCGHLAGTYGGFIDCCPNGWEGFGGKGRATYDRIFGCNGRDFAPIRGVAVKFGDITKVIAQDLYEKYFSTDNQSEAKE